MTSTSDSPPKHLWRVTPEQAQFDSPTFRVQLNPTQPCRGASVQPLSDNALSDLDRLGPLFQLAPPWGEREETLSDLYGRVEDLVITYEQQAPGTVRPQVYWRILSPSNPKRLGIEYVLSMQTDRLESTPSCGVVSQVLGPAEVRYASHIKNAESFESWGSLNQQSDSASSFAAAEGLPCVLFRPAGVEWSYLEMLYPGDFTQVEFLPDSSPAGIRIRWQLFAESLEKGVIRRARLRGFVIPREKDLEVARQLWSDFLVSELPLTT
jgi:hypothetical protein